MAKDGKVICLWHDCDWSKSSGITSVLWSKAVELNGADRSLIDMAAVDVSKEEESSQGGDEVIVPIETLPGEIPAQTMAPGSQAVNPGNQVGNPGSQVGNPGSQGTNPGSQGTNSGSQGTNSGSQGTNSGSPAGNPAMPGGTVAGTVKPGQEVTVPVPTIPPATESTDEVRIVPIG